MQISMRIRKKKKKTIPFTDDAVIINRFSQLPTGTVSYTNIKENKYHLLMTGCFFFLSFSLEIQFNNF